MHYIVYLDEFGHIGPYHSRSHPKYKESPVFGLAGYILPLTEVRGFGTWFYQRKCALLDWEIQEAKKGNSDFHPAMWEKKGSSLYTAKNIQKYPELKKFTNRLFNKIDRLGGYVFYVGLQKETGGDTHDANKLYYRILKEAIKRIDEFCLKDCEPNSAFFIIMDEHPQRENLLTKASMVMYNSEEPCKTMIEPPFQAESHRYQTLQAADWIAGLVGRFGAVWKNSEEFPENEIFRKYFEERLTKISKRSGIKSKSKENAMTEAFKQAKNKS